MKVDPKVVQAILSGAQTDSPADGYTVDATPEHMMREFVRNLDRIPGMSFEFRAEFARHFIPLFELLDKHGYPAFFSMQLYIGDTATRDLSFALRPQEAIFHLAHMALYGDAWRAELRQAFRRFVTGAAVKWFKDRGISPERLMGLPELPADSAELLDLQNRAYAYLLAPHAFDDIEDRILAIMIRQRIGQLAAERNITELAGGEIDGDW